MGFRETLHWVKLRYPKFFDIFIPLQAPLRSIVRYFHYIAVIKKSRSSKLEFFNCASRPSEGKVVALLTVKNEIDRIEACLLHHRMLGVSEFCIVDNGSIDGTLEFLAKQKDVNLYKTKCSYKNAYYGIAWINYLLHKHAKGRWALFIDADELLYVDYMEYDRPLIKCIEVLEDQKQSYLYAPMIDLYNFDDDKVRNTKTLEELECALQTAKHDLHGYMSGKYLRNGFRALTGGPRARIAQSFGRAEPLLTKFPLVQYNSLRFFTASAHEFLPDATEDHNVSGWLVHLKLGNEMARRHSDPSIEREHYGSGAEREHIARLGDQFLAETKLSSSKFEGIKSLEKIRSKISGKLKIK